jgi:hypothetical protein
MHCNDDSYSYMSNQIYGSFSTTHPPSWGPTLPAVKPRAFITMSCPFLLMASRLLPQTIIGWRAIERSACFSGQIQFDPNILKGLLPRFMLS